MEEIQYAIARNQVKAIFVTACELGSPEEFAHLKQLVPAWPPFYMRLEDFRQVMKEDQASDGDQRLAQGGSNPRQALSVDDPMLILVLDAQCFKELIGKVYDCLLGYCEY